MNKMFDDGLKAITDIQNRAIVEYTPLVNDICSRKATKDEVDQLLTWMFDFMDNESILLLVKDFCCCVFKERVINPSNSFMAYSFFEYFIYVLKRIITIQQRIIFPYKFRRRLILPKQLNFSFNFVIP